MTSPGWKTFTPVYWASPSQTEARCAERISFYQLGSQGSSPGGAGEWTSEDLAYNHINQLSPSGSLSVEDLQAVGERVKDESGVSDLRPVDHGNAWSLYFRDPEAIGSKFSAIPTGTSISHASRNSTFHYRPIRSEPNRTRSAEPHRASEQSNTISRRSRVNGLGKMPESRQKADMSAPDFDFAIIGYGPVGASLANLLGLCGLSPLSSNARPSVYHLPRAVALDGEGMRLVPVTHGLAEELLPKSTSAVTSDTSTPTGNCFVDHAKRDRTGGLEQAYRFYQPELENGPSQR